MKVVKLASFTAYGAATGFVVSGLGGAVLHARHGAAKDGLDDAIVGAAGGAAVNFVAGAIASFSPRAGLRHDVVELATSTVLVGALGGIVGSFILAGQGDHPHVSTRHEFVAGALGTVLAAAVGTAASIGLYGCRLALCCCPRAEHRVAELQNALLGRDRGTIDDLSADA